MPNRPSLPTAEPFQSPIRSPAAEFGAGARDVLPLIVGAIPFGLIFGTLGVSSGLSIGATLGLSVIVFAGSSQFIAVSMIAAGSGWLLVVLTAFIVNLRHLLYSVALVPHVRHLPPVWKLPIGFFLTDESFAIAIRRYEERDRSPFKHWYYMGAALTMYGSWQLCTVLGVAIGQLIPDATGWGLDFAMSVTFIGMIIPYIKTKPMGMAILVAGSVALLAHSLPHKLGLMVAAIAGIGAGMYSEQVIKAS